MKVLVIADIHGNAEALSAVLEQESDAERTVFLGDTISPGVQPNETIALLEQLKGTFIRGNHDLEIHNPALMEGWPEDWRALSEWVNETLDPAGYDFIASLKPEGEYEEGGVRMYLHHGELEDRPRSILPNSPDERISVMGENSNSPYVLFGHSHVQFQKTINGQTFINPGSVGQPRCGKPVASYGVFEDGVFTHRQVSYDPDPWLAALDLIRPLDKFPQFRAFQKQGLLTGYTLGERDPWTQFGKDGYV